MSFLQCCSDESVITHCMALSLFFIDSYLCFIILIFSIMNMSEFYSVFFPLSNEWYSAEAF